MINIAMTTGNSSRFIVTSWLLTPYCYVLQLFLYIYILYSDNLPKVHKLHCRIISLV